MGLNWTIKHEQELASFNCNKCKKLVDDMMEIQEMFYWKSHGGFCSIFGDGVTVEIVLCQECTVELLDDYIETIEEYK